MRITLGSIFLVFFSLGCAAQQQPPAQPAKQEAKPAADAQTGYILAPNDQVVIRFQEAEELNEKNFRVDSEGNINLPIVGRMKALGLSVEQFETALAERLKVYYRNPLVVVNVVERTRSAEQANPVFVVGAFRAPGVYGLSPRETVSDILVRSGGLQPNASHRIKLTRRIDQGAIDLPNARAEQDGKVTSVEITVNNLMETTNPAENLGLKPYDILTAVRVEAVYVTGEAGRTGAYPLEERQSLSILQVLSMSGGFTEFAAPTKARILRPILNTTKRAEIPIDLKSVLEGRTRDIPLLPNDVLYIPRGAGLSRGARTVALFTVPTVISSVLFSVFR